ncbi:hypothetical protein ACFQ6Q_34885 [Streptomyces sp. NPDC056437]
MISWEDSPLLFAMVGFLNCRAAEASCIYRLELSCGQVEALKERR